MTVWRARQSTVSNETAQKTVGLDGKARPARRARQGAASHTASTARATANTTANASR